MNANLPNPNAQRNMFRPVRVNERQVKPLVEFLNEQDEILLLLGRVLKEERRALRERDMKQLGLVSKEKSTLMVRLQSNDQRIKLHPECAQLKTTFADRMQAIKESLLTCKKTNDANGRLLELCSNTTRRMSSLLMKVRDQSTMNLTYTSKGNTTARGPMRVSISA
ncbi:MAG: flagellar protein FlgN [Succinivibrio sp.]|nr:flagellar protein FlgN [Succinivibrio sp.]